MVGQIDEQADAAVELLDDNRPIVGVGVVAVLVLELGGGHQVTPEFARVARAGQLRADDVFAFRLAIEQQPVGPDDVLARQAARVLIFSLIRHRPFIVPPTLGL